MRDQLIQDIAAIIYGYYQARGSGLEKTCNLVIDAIEAHFKAIDLAQYSNVFKLSELGIDSLSWNLNDILLGCEHGRLIMYQSDIIYPYNTPTLKDVKWKKKPEVFGSPVVSIDDLLSKGETVYLMRSI